MNPLTTDTFYNGRIQVKQNKSGYRFSIDAVLLASHACPREDDKVLDLGTGCGIIPLMLAYRNPKIKIYGVELQKALAEIAVINIKDNNMEDRVTILCLDIKDLKQDMVSGPVDLVVCNPPYRKVKSGRMNPDEQRAVARHEIKVTLYDVIETSCRMLHTSGKFITIYPAERLVDIISQMRSAGIEPKFFRMVYSKREAEAKLILLEGVKGGRPGIKIGPPLIIYHKDGSYTDELEKMMEGNKETEVGGRIDRAKRFHQLSIQSR
ncbi:MAG: tRNA1(Val) (adenine(37)-N6)-methyltransferase [Deltaproteobacteria bacterium]|nr:tRNA1(Val) (adenine(37)-N6)-methyltransferase [Deltaproteobacteria bacterium]MBW2661034.1 tRNA1(Val) (adenine(37)-N6)-methyltransferase [Deltaproteobacteria bacterium]